MNYAEIREILSNLAAYLVVDFEELEDVAITRNYISCRIPENRTLPKGWEPIAEGKMFRVAGKKRICYQFEMQR
jgi:hypothetical protein